MTMKTRRPKTYGMQRERAHSGGPAAGGGPRLPSPSPPALTRAPVSAQTVPCLRSLHAHLEGQRQLLQGVKQGPRYWQEPSGISDGKEDGKVAFTCPYPGHGPAPSTQPHRPPGTFLPPNHSCCFPPPPAHLALAPSPGMPTAQQLKAPASLL